MIASLLVLALAFAQQPDVTHAVRDTPLEQPEAASIDTASAPGFAPLEQNDSTPPAEGAPAYIYPSPPPAPVSTHDQATSDRFVVAVFPALTFGLSVVPSAEVPVFLGTMLRRPAGDRWPGRRWSVGYQFTASGGLADRYFGGMFTHRHHVTAMNIGNIRHHLFGAIGGGVALILDFSPILEIEGRVGYVFGKAPLGCPLGVLGLISRVGWNIGKLERAPVPQIGLFIGGFIGPRKQCP